MNVLGLAVGGGVGAAARYVISSAIARRFPDGVPVGTLVVNGAGSLLLGVVAGAHLAGNLSVDWATWLGTGFLGAFTTFSTFTYETIELAAEKQERSAALNIVLTLAVTIPLGALGFYLGR